MQEIRQERDRMMDEDAVRELNRTAPGVERVILELRLLRILSACLIYASACSHSTHLEQYNKCTQLPAFMVCCMRIEPSYVF